MPDVSKVRKVPRQVMERARGCYNCGSKLHWGDDCPRLEMEVRAWRKANGGVFNAEYAELFILDDGSGFGGDEGGYGDQGGSQGVGRGYQMAMFDDGRDF